LQLFFTIDDENTTKDCVLQIRKCKSQDDFKEIPADAAVFGAIRKKAQAIHAIRAKNDFQYHLNEKLTDAQRKALEPKYEKAEAASKLEHDAWAKEAKLIVEKYWRKNIALFK
jgi:predicted ATP-grasp superfamily ATP-dependent carboligase